MCTAAVWAGTPGLARVPFARRIPLPPGSSVSLPVWQLPRGGNRAETTGQRDRYTRRGGPGRYGHPRRLPRTTPACGGGAQPTPGGVPRQPAARSGYRHAGEPLQRPVHGPSSATHSHGAVHERRAVGACSADTQRSRSSVTLAALVCGVHNGYAQDLLGVASGALHLGLLSPGLAHKTILLQFCAARYSCRKNSRTGRARARGRM